jgi:hypothetical protein
MAPQTVPRLPKRGTCAGWRSDNVVFDHRWPLHVGTIAPCDGSLSVSISNTA